MIKLIVALDKNNLIGNGNKMPWNIKEEFIHFKKTTLNNALLFGKNTFLGLPKKLENRIVYVLSGETLSGCDRTIHNEKELLELFNFYKTSKEILFIAGGKFIYEKYYHYADELIISKIKNEYKGDIYLNLDLSKYELFATTNKKDFIVEYYKKVI
ncbi:dihydrofolate reductase [Mycoplasmopsis lipofaciens]|uniref:dihydrofolate reductase n=1 Tax=Mycoplasmopsis lipofaciens TaxID=114884 RepID=UPI000489ED8C|nr:dihydrofolate reductase [Mycoplasmopsis lipofaciens]